MQGNYKYTLTIMTCAISFEAKNKQTYIYTRWNDNLMYYSVTIYKLATVVYVTQKHHQNHVTKRK